MRTFILICTLLLCCQCFAQQSTNEYFFKEVGWSITLPDDFYITDSAVAAATREHGKKAMEEVTGVSPDMSTTTTLITANKNKYNYFSATITTLNVQESKDFAARAQQVKNLMYKTFCGKMPDAKIDTSSTQETIDGLLFDKFQMTVSMKEKVLFNMYLLVKLHKGYDFGISYLCLDEATKEQVETMLKHSKFSK
jgi:hypothetical protein